MDQTIDKHIDPSVEMMEIEILGKILDLPKLNLTKELQGKMEVVMVNNGRKVVVIVENFLRLMMNINIVEILLLVKTMIMETLLVRKEELLILVALILEDKSVVEIHSYNINNRYLKKDHTEEVNIKDTNQLFHKEHRERRMQKMISFRICSKTNFQKKMKILLA